MSFWEAVTIVGWFCAAALVFLWIWCASACQDDREDDYQ